MAIKKATSQRRTSRPTARPILRIAPGAEGVSIWSDELFAEPAGPDSRQFLSCAFSVQEVAAIDIQPAESFGRIRYDPSGNAEEIWRKLSHVFQSRSSRETEESLKPLGVDKLFLGGPSAIPIRVNRVGTHLSTWRLRYEGRNRVRLSHPILLNQKDVAYRLEQELSFILGVEDFRTSVLSGSVIVYFDPHLLNVPRLVRRLESAGPQLLQKGKTFAGRPSRKRLAAAVGLLGLSFTGQYLVPSLRPLAILGVATYGFPNVKNAVRELVQGKIGLPALYTAGLTFMLLSGMPFSSTVMAVFMQFWPQLAHQSLTRGQRRLFATHRQRATWARVLGDDGLEIEVDLDTVNAGDLITVRGGEIVPVDGVVTEGLAAIDEEVLSGVAGALDKAAGDSVYAATFVRDGQITVRVEKVGGETIAGTIGAQLPYGKLDLPSSAEAEKIANRMAKPALAISAINLITTGIVRPSQAVIRPDYATGPRLSAQLAALHDIGDGLHQGIFFRKPAAVDLLSTTDVYIFDDTSALERRQIKVGEIISEDGISDQLVLGHAAAAFPAFQNERGRALADECIQRLAPIPEIHERTRLAGAVSYRDADNHLLIISSPAYLAARGFQIPLAIAEEMADSPHAWAAQGMDTRRQSTPHQEIFLRPLWVLRDGRVLGVITFHRKGEWEGKEIVAALQKRNAKARFIYLSSHAQARAEAIAEKIGILTVSGELDKNEKATIIEKYGRRTMWIGDGSSVDSLPAIKASTVSISVAGVSSIATDAADVVLFQSSLHHLVPLRQIGRGHRARLDAAYRAIYAANLLAVAGGFLGGFGSLEAGLTSNVGTGYAYSMHRRWLQALIAKVETRRKKLVVRGAEENGPHAPSTSSHVHETDERADSSDLIQTTPSKSDSEGI